MKRTQKRCVCKKNINLLTDKYVVVATYNNENGKDEEVFFHFNCWVDYFDSRVEKRARTIIENMQTKVMQIANSPIMRNLLSQIGGSDQLLSMLKTPLNKDKSVLKSKIKEKLHGQKNGKKRRKNTKKTL